MLAGGGAVFRRVTLRRASLPLRRGLVCSERVSGCGRLHTFRGELSLPAPGVPSGGSAWPPSGTGSPAPRSLTALLGGRPRLRGHAPSEVTRPFGGRVPNGCPSCSLTPSPSLAPRSHPGTHRGTTFPAPVGLPPPAPPRTHKPRKEAASLVRRGGCPGGVPLPCETNTAPSRSLWAGISASHSTEGKKHLFLNISTVTVK